VNLTQRDLISFLREGLNVDGPVEGETELFSSGLLDSVSMVGLIGFIEEKARVTIQPSDVTLENFDSIARIVDYVRGLG
jgi:acyl carrier protein